MKKTSIEKANEMKQAKQAIKKGDTVYTILRSVSASGMSRVISFYVMKRGKPVMIDYIVHNILGYSYGKGDGVKVGGCGMDMGYHVVSTLSSVLGYSKNGTPDNKTNCYGLNTRWL